MKCSNGSFVFLLHEPRRSPPWLSSDVRLPNQIMRRKSPSPAFDQVLARGQARNVRRLLPRNEADGLRAFEVSSTLPVFEVVSDPNWPNQSPQPTPGIVTSRAVSR